MKSPQKGNSGLSRVAFYAQGLTLIEVLIALAVVSIALTAIIKATAQTIKSTQYIQDKTIANWVGDEIINEVRLGLLNVPVNDEVEQERLVLGNVWVTKVSVEETPNKSINKLMANVYKEKSDNPLMKLESYLSK